MPRPLKLVIILSIAIFALLLLFVLVVGCYRLWLYHSGPLEQAGDVWVSEDGRITIVTLKNQRGKGEFRTEDAILEFDVVQRSLECSLSITYPGVNIVLPGTEATAEAWTVDRKSEDEYVVTVDFSYTGYFAEGETITFYRVKSNK